MGDTYRRDQIARVLRAGAKGPFRLKVSGQSESKWLNVSADELRALAALLYESGE